MGRQDEADYLVGGEGVEAGGGLVHEEHLGVGHQRNADVGALALPTCTNDMFDSTQQQPPCHCVPSQPC